MSAYLDWHVGMKVVCVKAGWHGLGAHSEAGVRCPLVEGAVYVVKAIEPFTDGCYPNPAPINVELEGVTKPNVPSASPNNWFNADRFRPVVKRTTDISIFTALLTPSEDDKAEIELLDYELAHAPMQEPFR